jgi:threonyl-tRNA synthetase
MDDALGRKWQIGTIQLDSQMPSRFGLKYVGADNAEHDLYVVHRALYGSFERFIGILIEHYGGAFPAWLAPVQVRLIPVAERHREQTAGIAGRLREAGVRVEVDERDETVSKRVRDAELEKTPYTIVYGDRDSPEVLAVRSRDEEGLSSASVESLIETLAKLKP